MTTPDLWFAAAPREASTIGTVPGTGVRYAVEPSDGARVWAVSCQPVAPQQREHSTEFAIMPDALLHGLGYRLTAIAGVRLPASLSSVVEQGPEALNRTTHPFEPALLAIGAVDLLALRRHFDPLDVYVSIGDSHWICAVCPSGQSPAMRAVSL